MTLMIENPGKIGIGTWDFDSRGTALTHVEALNFGWYYNWRGEALWDVNGGVEPLSSKFVPMIWGRAEVDSVLLEQITKSSAVSLLGFNEPDHKPQANMSVEEALALWPELMATGKRLGSPAPTTHGALGDESWLGRFMQGAQDKGYQVDFIAAHYYADDKDVGAFKAYLESLHDAYGLPIWVTEWALVDWLNPDRFAPEEIATFASEAIQMMDGLAFVERHAWFGAYAGGDGWHVNTELYDSKGQLTSVGDVFAQALGGHLAGGDGNEYVAGTSEGDVLYGTSGDDVLRGGPGDDVLYGLAGDDTLYAGEGNNVLKGGPGNDRLNGGPGDDKLFGGTGDDVLKAKGGNNVLKGGPGNDKVVGGPGDDWLFGGKGDDVLKAGGGNNVLYSGPGKDKLISGPGADTFVYRDIAHIGKGSDRDGIKYFKPGTDLLDMSAIDANSNVGGNQAFTFIGAATFSAAGQLRYDAGLLAGDVNGNGKADFQLRFANLALLTSEDILV